MTDLTIGLSCDNGETLYINGNLIGSSSDWATASVYTVPLQPGENVIAVHGTDAGGIAGMIAEMYWDAEVQITDSSWKVSTTAPAGWNSPGFDDSGWAAATEYGAYGVAPWYKNIAGFPSASVAQWIWTNDRDADNDAYFRFVITLASPPVITAPDSLPEGTVGAAYSVQATAANGQPPYTWNDSTTLPDGIAIDYFTGLINGTPTQAGTYAVTISVSDSANKSSSRSYTLVVSEPSGPPPRFSEAYKEACASAPSDPGSILYNTIEIVHPEVKDASGNVVPIRFVDAVEDVDAMLELSAEYNPGEVVAFVALPINIVPQSSGEERTPTLQISLPNTDPALANFIELAMLHSRWMHIVYRPYLRANLGVGPEMNPPLKLPVRGLKMTDSVITLSAAADNLVNRQFPNKSFNAQTHPGLVR